MEELEEFRITIEGVFFLLGCIQSQVTLCEREHSI